MDTMNIAKIQAKSKVVVAKANVTCGRHSALPTDQRWEDIMKFNKHCRFAKDARAKGKTKCFSW